MPSENYIQHLSLIMYLSMQKPYLHISILEAAPRLLDYPGMHFLLKPLLEICENHYPQALKLCFYIISFPNYYKNTALYDPDDKDLKYIDLKPIIRNTLELCVEKPDLAAMALYGLTIYALKEITSKNPTNSYTTIIDVVLKKCLSYDDSVALAAFNCLQPLINAMPELASQILAFLMDDILSTIPASREKVLKTALSAIQHCLLTSNNTFEPQIISNLFSNLSILLISVEGNTSLEAEINSLSSFLAIYYLNFPLKAQKPAMFQSLMTENEIGTDKLHKISHFAIGSTVIFSMVFSASKAKFIIRNQFGRFYWEAEDFRIFNPSTRHDDLTKIFNIIKSTSINLNSNEPPKTLEDEPLLPLLIEYISNNYTDCYTKEKSIEPGQEMLRFMDNVEELEAECEVIESRIEPEPANYNLIRYFVSNFGLLEKLVPLETGERLDRGIVLLDNCQPREPIKIGIIYVGPGQQDEKEILANSGGSLRFQIFVQSLGTVIDLGKHIGNLGGLDPGGSVGLTTISYAD